MSVTANFNDFHDFNLNALQNLNHLNGMRLNLNLDAEFYLLNYLGSPRTLHKMRLVRRSLFRCPSMAFGVIEH